MPAKKRLKTGESGDDSLNQPRTESESSGHSLRHIPNDPHDNPANDAQDAQDVPSNTPEGSTSVFDSGGPSQLLGTLAPGPAEPPSNTSLIASPVPAPPPVDPPSKTPLRVSASPSRAPLSAILNVAPSVPPPMEPPLDKVPQGIETAPEPRLPLIWNVAAPVPQPLPASQPLSASQLPLAPRPPSASQSPITMYLHSFLQSSQVVPLSAPRLGQNTPSSEAPKLNTGPPRPEALPEQASPVQYHLTSHVIQTTQPCGPNRLQPYPQGQWSLPHHGGIFEIYRGGPIRSHMLENFVVTIRPAAVEAESQYQATSESVKDHYTNVRNVLGLEVEPSSGHQLLELAVAQQRAGSDISLRADAYSGYRYPVGPPHPQVTPPPSAMVPPHAIEPLRPIEPRLMEHPHSTAKPLSHVEIQEESEERYQADLRTARDGKAPARSNDAASDAAGGPAIPPLSRQRADTRSTGALDVLATEATARRKAPEGPSSVENLPNKEEEERGRRQMKEKESLGESFTGERVAESVPRYSWSARRRELQQVWGEEPEQTRLGEPEHTQQRQPNHSQQGEPEQAARSDAGQAPPGESAPDGSDTTEHNTHHDGASSIEYEIAPPPPPNTGDSMAMFMDGAHHPIPTDWRTWFDPAHPAFKERIAMLEAREAAEAAARLTDLSPGSQYASPGSRRSQSARAKQSAPTGHLEVEDDERARRDSGYIGLPHAEPITLDWEAYRRWVEANPEEVTRIAAAAAEAARHHRETCGMRPADCRAHLFRQAARQIGNDAVFCIGISVGIGAATEIANALGIDGATFNAAVAAFCSVAQAAAGPQTGSQASSDRQRPAYSPITPETQAVSESGAPSDSQPLFSGLASSGPLSIPDTPVVSDHPAASDPPVSSDPPPTFDVPLTSPVTSGAAPTGDLGSAADTAVPDFSTISDAPASHDAATLDAVTSSDASLTDVDEIGGVERTQDPADITDPTGEAHAGPSERAPDQASQGIPMDLDDPAVPEVSGGEEAAKGSAGNGGKKDGRRKKGG